jgi:hypothetical protein
VTKRSFVIPIPRKSGNRDTADTLHKIRTGFHAEPTQKDVDVKERRVSGKQDLPVSWKLKDDDGKARVSKVRK